MALNDGKLRGGDSMMVYIGSYNENAGTLNVDMKAVAHTAVPGMASVFGVNNVDISLTGKVDGMHATLLGSSPQAPGVRLSVTLERYCD